MEFALADLRGKDVLSFLYSILDDRLIADAFKVIFHVARGSKFTYQLGVDSEDR